MTMLDDGRSSELVAYYRQVLQTHAGSAATGVCPVCQIVRCPDWLDAYDRLAAANPPMGEPNPWTPPPSRRKP